MCADGVLAPAAATRSPGTVVARVVAGRAVRSAAVWGAVFGVYLVASPLGYANTYKTAAQRAALVKSFGSNTGVNAIIGPARGIDTVAGFTAWRSLGVLGVVGAVWGVLTATRLLRGEEDAGRWELLLAGLTTRRAAAFQAMAGLVAGLSVLYAVPAVVLTAVGRSSQVRFTPSAALFDVLAIASSAAAFLVIGALASQLAPTRRRAAAYGTGVLAAAYALRMLADSGTDLEWLRWTTPLGWIEEARPLTGSRPLALMPVVALVVIVGGVAGWLGGARDLGASAVPDRTAAASHTRWLGGPFGLSLHVVRSTLIGWVVGIAIGSAMTGFVAKSAGQAMANAGGFRQTLGRLGAHGLGARLYLGVVFLVVAVLVALLAAGQLSGIREEEASGRIDHLLARPVSREAWLLDRFAIAGGALIVAGLVAGVFGWLGAASQRSGLGLDRMLAAGLNVVPPAIVVLGLGTLAFGLRPRSVTAVSFGLIAWSFLVELIGSLVNASHWLLDSSVFHHMAAAPAASPNWPGNLILVAIGVGAAAAGVVAFSRRDITGE